MKVLVITSWYPNAWNPVQGVFVAEQVRVASRQFDVAVIAPTLRTVGTFLPGRRQWAVETDSATPVVRPQVLSPIPGRPAYVAAPYARAVARAYRELEASWGRPDVIHAHVVLNAGHAAARLGRALGVPVVLTEHATSGSTWLKAMPGSDLVRRTLEAIPIHVAVSPSLAERIRTVSSVEVRVIGNVVDTEFFQPVRSPRAAGPLRIASVGGLIPRKGMDSLLRAVAMAGHERPTGWEVRVAGKGPELQRLEALSRDLGIAHQVTFIGEVSLAGVRDLYAWADVAALPSHEETFGVAAAEAMAMERPVIGFANTGFAYVTGAVGGRLVPDNDDEGLRDALEAVASGDLMFDGAASRQSIVDRFGPDAFLSQIDELYRDAISGRQRQREGSE